VAELRAANAYERLRTGRPTVAEVAGEMGFCDIFHFSKAFRHEYGFPPSAMRGRDGKPRFPAVASQLDSPCVPRLTDRTFDIFPFVA
jgi:AraC-like DNA-binding protein